MTGLRRIPNTTLIDGEKIDNLPTDTNASLAAKQDTLVSGKNIKTIGGKSLLGSGDINISLTGDVIGPATNTDSYIPQRDGVNTKTLKNGLAVPQGGLAGLTALGNKVEKNAAIVGATKTKITYDAKGLVTDGEDATTADIADSTDKRYVTDAQLTVLGNTSGINTGDQDLSGLASKTNVLELDNTDAFTPTADYHPATKKYVDDNAGDMLASTYDPNNIADDAFDMDNMVEGTTNKHFTATIATRLADTSGTNSGDEDTTSIKTKLGAASTSTDGYLTSTDWNTFNGKQTALVSGTNIKTVGGTTLLGSGDIDGGTGNIGYLNIPQVSKSANYTLVLGDAGKSIDHPSSDANARTFTIPSNASVAYPIGTTISFSNMASQDVTIAITTDTMYLAGDGATGSRTLAQYGVATVRKLTATTRLISGVGLT